MGEPTTIFRVRCAHIDLRSTTEPKGGPEFRCEDCARAIAIERWRVVETVRFRVYNEHGEECVPDYDEEHEAIGEVMDQNADIECDDDPRARWVKVTKRTLRRIR